jgi:hypothetical protein
MADYLTPEQLAEFQEIERAIMRRRGERSIAKAAAEKAKATQSAANATPPQTPSNIPTAPYRVELIDGSGPKLSTSQAQEMAQAYRENYASYCYDDEHINLLEARLAAAAKADGWELPPMLDALKL